jgi:HAD superfamily hydrolase (TIGR01509 family)
VTSGFVQFRELDPGAARLLLCDADGNLFGSEEPAFVASAAVTNRLLASVGIDRTFTPDELRRRAVGRNFRAMSQELLAEDGRSLDAAELDPWVSEEQRAVIAHLASVLRPDTEVTAPLERLAGRFELAVVSSSADRRLTACFTAAGLDDLFPPQVRFSAEDSLPVPTSKPDPAIYTFAGERLGVAGTAAIAIEDAPSGALSAVAAGFPTIGNLQFVAAEEREGRIEALREAGVAAIADSWSDIAALLAPARAGRGPLLGVA